MYLWIGLGIDKENEEFIREYMPFASLHVDVPFCFEHEKEVLRKAGFNEVELVRKWTNTKLYKCKK